MKSIYEMILEEKVSDTVYTVQDGQGEIISICDTEEQAKEAMEKFNKEMGGKVSKVVPAKSSEFVAQ